jgi:hypothetical protein
MISFAMFITERNSEAKSKFLRKDKRLHGFGSKKMALK